MDKILADKPDAGFWTDLTSTLTREGVLTSEEYQGVASRSALLRVFLDAALAGRIAHPEKYVMFPWYTWFTNQVPQPVDLQKLVEAGAAVFESPPAEFEEVRRGLTRPGDPDLEWPVLRAYLFRLTTREFLQDYLTRRDVPLGAPDTPLRHLFLKFALLVKGKVASRSDLNFLGIESQLPQDSRVTPNTLFKSWLREKDQHASLRPYVHGDPDRTQLDKDLEEGRVAVLKLDPEANADEIARLEHWLDRRFLESWISFRALKSDELKELTWPSLYGVYLDLVTCSEASGHDHDPDFCRLQRDQAHKVEQGDLSPPDKFHADLLRFVASNYISLEQDPAHLRDEELNALAVKLADPLYIPGPMSRKTAHAVINRAVEQKLEAKEFEEVALERGLRTKEELAASNAKRVRFFLEEGCAVTNLAQASRDLDLVHPAGVQGRALADNLMRQYLELLHLYSDCGDPDPMTLEAVLRDFVLKHQFF